MPQKGDVIAPEIAKTLDGMFQERVRRSAAALAYKNFDEPGVWKDYTWGDVEKLVARWQAGFEGDGLQLKVKLYVLKMKPIMNAEGNFRNENSLVISKTFFSAIRSAIIGRAIRRRSCFG